MAVDIVSLVLQQQLRKQAAQEQLALETESRKNYQRFLSRTERREKEIEIKKGVAGAIEALEIPEGVDPKEVAKDVEGRIRAGQTGNQLLSEMQAKLRQDRLVRAFEEPQPGSPFVALKPTYDSLKDQLGPEFAAELVSSQGFLQEEINLSRMREQLNASFVRAGGDWANVSEFDDIVNLSFMTNQGMRDAYLSLRGTEGTDYTNWKKFVSVYTDPSSGAIYKLEDLTSEQRQDLRAFALDSIGGDAVNFERFYKTLFEDRTKDPTIRSYAFSQVATDLNQMRSMGQGRVFSLWLNNPDDPPEWEELQGSTKSALISDGVERGTYDAAMKIFATAFDPTTGTKNFDYMTTAASDLADMIDIKEVMRNYRNDVRILTTDIVNNLSNIDLLVEAERLGLTGTKELLTFKAADQIAKEQFLLQLQDKVLQAKMKEIIGE